MRSRKTFSKQVAARLSKAMAERDVSPSDLARSLDASRQQVHDWVHGIRTPSFETAVKIAKALDLSLDYLGGLKR